MDEYKFPSEPVANDESTIVGPEYRFTIIDDKVLRYEWAADGVFEDRASTFAINRKFAKPEFRVEEKKNQLDIITPAFHLTYDKQRFSPNGLAVAFSSKQTERGVEWRYGNVAEDNLGGTARTVDDIDGRCDLGTGIISKAGYSVLDDSSSMLFDGNGFVTTRRPGDRIDGYLFCYGHDFKGAMKSFYAISGSQPSVPRWCLGNWWSRYHAYTQEEYLTLVDKFKANNIPLSVAVIDMDWHFVTGENVPHVGWTGYTWNKELFPDPEKFTAALHDKGLKVTLNDHPHAGVHNHEDSYEEMAKALGHDISKRTPILFDPTSQGFMHAFFHILHRNLEKQGCDFWWIDWQQGSFSRIPGFDPLWLLNHFHYLDIERTKGKSEALIFSRYAGPGSHRYPVGFSGDAVATWDSLKFQPEFTATASNIGYGWWSHDIGGHIGGSRDDECTVRWVQYAVFSPILRLHSSNSKWMSKEPWLYRSESEAAMRNAMQLRHRLVPYIYSASVAEPSLNLPLVQPLYWNFPAHKSAYNFPTEYYFGDALVVAPILSPRDRRTNLAKTRVWVPPGRHVDIFSGTVYDGDQEIDMYRPLEQIPVLAAEGSIIPLDREAVPANGCANPGAFEVLVVVGKDGQTNIYENTGDDAESIDTSESRRSIPICYEQTSGRLTFLGADREWTFRFISTKLDISAMEVSVDGKALENVQIDLEYNKYVPEIVIRIPVSSNMGEFAIELGSEPQLSTLRHTQAIEDLLLDFQISPLLKDSIWEIIERDSPTSGKMARLLGLDLESSVIGPITELLLADSR
ncbi:putative alpha-xylosidase [Microthyrium microscopicum]|uniref:alpha-glucosidase n=1 Tax=Microthyrium microscopicum TaxID=703497 RepID=A0A6A6U831_9PEZI|nr:putative alpha-xylosidase [Microthyrium microscopicum]